MEIFGNKISSRVYSKAVRTQKKYIHKFGDDRNIKYALALEQNKVITPAFDCSTIVIKDGASFTESLPPKPVIIGNIRMGFGHYRISMAMASAAHAMGYTPLWMDLNSFPQTTCTKIISSQNDLYSTGSRLSQKSRLFNRLVWEPLNYEGFKKLSYNAKDQVTSQLMTSVFGQIPKDIPFIATHVWPSQAAVHAGMQHVVNAIPDNWPMALHLSEGAVHTVQTWNAYWGYRTLNGFDGDKILKPMQDKDIVFTGHYIDHELVSNIHTDCINRIKRAKNGKPIRFLFTIGGAGAQGDFFASIIKTLLPYVKQNKACIYINCGDYENVWTQLKQKLPELAGTLAPVLHFDNWQEERLFAQSAIDNEDEKSGQGIHVFFNKDIFAAVYITNLMMRASDILITKPSELAFYPVPKLFIRRIGGHEKWGAIHSAELGDGTQECETPQSAGAAVEQLLQNPLLIEQMCCNIINEQKKGTYNGAYHAIELATGNYNQSI
jgi:methionine salvage enolase-phosphatase E1